MQVEDWDNGTGADVFYGATLIAHVGGLSAAQAGSVTLVAELRADVPFSGTAGDDEVAILGQAGTKVHIEVSGGGGDDVIGISGDVQGFATGHLGDFDQGSGRAFAGLTLYGGAGDDQISTYPGDGGTDGASEIHGGSGDEAVTLGGYDGFGSGEAREGGEIWLGEGDDTVTLGDPGSGQQELTYAVMDFDLEHDALVLRTREDIAEIDVQFEKARAAWPSRSPTARVTGPATPSFSRGCPSTIWARSTWIS